jgi:hypothetical protein
MASRVDIIVFFLCFIVCVSNNLTKADWGLSAKEELEFQKQFINLKKFAIKSIQVRFLNVTLLLLLIKSIFLSKIDIRYANNIIFIIVIYAMTNYDCYICFNLH